MLDILENTFRECHLWVHSCFFFGYLTWMVCEMWGKWLYKFLFVGYCFQDLMEIAHRILVLFPSNFFSCISYESRWCIHTVVLTQPWLGRNLISFYQGDQISIWLTTCQWQSTPSLCICWNHFQLMRYCSGGMWTGLLFQRFIHISIYINTLLIR